MPLQEQAHHRVLQRHCEVEAHRRKVVQVREEQPVPLAPLQVVQGLKAVVKQRKEVVKAHRLSLTPFEKPRL